MSQYSFLQKYNIDKAVATFFVLLFCFSFFLLFFTLHTKLGHWASMSLVWLPLFFAEGVLMGWAIVLHEWKEQEMVGQLSLKNLMQKAFVSLLPASFYAIPLMALFLVLWIGLGVFELFHHIPVLGELTAILFAFVPFLLNMGILWLGLLGVFALHVLPPELVKGGQLQAFDRVFRQVIAEPKKHLKKFFQAILPLCILGVIGFFTFEMSLPFLVTQGAGLSPIQWLVLAVPLSILLAPGFLFFILMPDGDLT